MTTDIVHTFLLIALLPAWLLVGLADWWLHRTSTIEKTSGVRESVVHLVLSGQAAAAILPALLFEINGLILALTISMFVAHELTTNLDVHLAVPARVITPAEIRIHNFLTAVPFAGVLLVLATHTDQAAALFGAGNTPVDFQLRWKTPALPTAYLLGWICAAAAFNVLPFLEELARCIRARRGLRN